MFKENVNENGTRKKRVVSNQVSVCAFVRALVRNRKSINENVVDDLQAHKKKIQQQHKQYEAKKRNVFFFNFCVEYIFHTGCFRHKNLRRSLTLV